MTRAGAVPNLRREGKTRQFVGMMPLLSQCAMMSVTDDSRSRLPTYTTERFTAGHWSKVWAGSQKHLSSHVVGYDRPLIWITVSVVRGRPWRWQIQRLDSALVRAFASYNVVFGSSFDMSVRCSAL